MPLQIFPDVDGEEGQIDWKYFMATEEMVDPIRLYELKVMGLNDVNLTDDGDGGDGGGGGEGKALAVACSICVEAVADNGDSSWFKLQCGHQFHLAASRILTGGVLLLRNKYYIIFYRGKDFVPPTVAATLAERQELTKQIQDVEEQTRGGPAEVAALTTDEQAVASTLAEFYEAQARWGREISAEEREKMLQEAAMAKTTRVVQRLEQKLELSQAKKLKAEKLLAKIVESWNAAGPSDE